MSILSSIYRELFKCYQDWCDDYNENAVSERFFSLKFKEMGLEQKRLTDGRYWQGIGFQLTRSNARGLKILCNVPVAWRKRSFHCRSDERKT